jgi:hypothetical protein
MANTYDFIASSTIGSGGASSIGFSSISSSYTDLCLKFSLRSSSTSGTYDAVRITVNGNTSNIAIMDVYGTGSSAGSEIPGTTDSNVFTYTSNSSNTANTFGNLEMYFPNYAGTSYAKPMSADGVSETNASGAIVVLTAGHWNSTSAINSISIAPYLGGSTFVQYTTAYLYGIKNS